MSSKSRKGAFNLRKTINILRKVGRRTVPLADHKVPTYLDDHDDRSKLERDFDDLFQESMREVLEAKSRQPTPGPLERDTSLFFLRLESVLHHVLDRVETLASKGAAFLDKKLPERFER